MTKKFLLLGLLAVLLGLGGLYWSLSQVVVTTSQPETKTSLNLLGATTPIPTTVRQTLLPQLNLQISPWLALGCLAGLLLFWLGLYGYHSAAQRQRDQRRRADLVKIMQGFEQYKAKYGRYPASSSLNAHYYSVVNLANDWHYYGLPTPDIMKEFLPDWPILDPLHPAGNPDQTNQYLYFPHDDSQRYDVFAHLEQPTTAEAEDCNDRDGIPRALGIYNYRAHQVVQPEPEKSLKASDKT